MTELTDLKERIHSMRERIRKEYPSRKWEEIYIRRIQRINCDMLRMAFEAITPNPVYNGEKLIPMRFTLLEDIADWKRKGWISEYWDPYNQDTGGISWIIRRESGWRFRFRKYWDMIKHWLFV